MCEDFAMILPTPRDFFSPTYYDAVNFLCGFQTLLSLTIALSLTFGEDFIEPQNSLVTN